eukprot:c53415_g1_i1.p1 GENE.c53415_g1_i1~~c53415_g1_i1.p1  ORF type:complete len:349 (+),score=36.23 c53415_g1_i1:91-1137(+)
MAHPIVTINSHESGVWSVAITSDGSITASGDEHGIVLFDVKRNRVVKTLPVNSIVYRVAVSPKNDRLVATCERSILIFDLVADVLLHSLQGDMDAIVGLDVCWNARLIAAGGSGDLNLVKVWSLDGGSALHTFSGHHGLVRALAFSRNGEILISGSRDATIRIWDCVRGSLLHTLHTTDPVRSIAVSPDNAFMVSATWGSDVKIWDLVNRTLIRSLSGHKDWISNLAISSNGQFVVSLSDDGQMNEWNATNYELLRSTKAHEGITSSISLSKFGAFIVTSGRGDKLVKVWQSRWYELTQHRIQAFLLGTHRNVGGSSVVRMLPPDIVGMIASQVMSCHESPPRQLQPS